MGYTAAKTYNNYIAVHFYFKVRNDMELHPILTEKNVGFLTDVRKERFTRHIFCIMLRNVAKKVYNNVIERR